MKLLASAPNREEMKKLIERFWFSPHVDFNESGEIYNSKGIITGYRVAKKGARYRFERINN